jgi:hypothetical protein
VYLDAPRVKSRQEGKSRVKSVYAALGVNFEGKKGKVIRSRGQLAVKGGMYLSTGIDK